MSLLRVKSGEGGENLRKIGGSALTAEIEASTAALMGGPDSKVMVRRPMRPAGLGFSVVLTAAMAS